MSDYKDLLARDIVDAVVKELRFNDLATASLFGVEKCVCGAHDDMPELCDDCWAHVTAMRESKEVSP